MSREGIAISILVLYVSKGGHWIIFNFIVTLPMPCRGCVSDIWDSLDHARVYCKFIVLLEELV